MNFETSSSMYHDSSSASLDFDELTCRRPSVDAPGESYCSPVNAEGDWINKKYDYNNANQESNSGGFSTMSGRRNDKSNPHRRYAFVDRNRLGWDKAMADLHEKLTPSEAKKGKVPLAVLAALKDRFWSKH
jgi:hypothetical protein